MKFLTTILALLSIAITGTSAWKEFEAIEFTTTDCTGWIKHAAIGMKPEYWQIKTNNESNSVYASTVNDGIYRWYAFSETSETGCAGDVLGRVWTGLLAHDDYGCAAIGQGE
ncbi:uncharacterized protein F4822DRAFT_430106 [Hypoxylon trugodes]|uniref:uncharacterized protein n=1 Tax=Hypoxylon trugodes TaxID=326681 RepID=UPI00219AF38E|nr:uncharacterized protein F4822DRAFT_430106 [Hypoxylon trugodes]KAI1387354.1 hypothetical protein F4822DRAFT_430106 [Hypoxylon trugodes]